MLLASQPLRLSKSRSRRALLLTLVVLLLAGPTATAAVGSPEGAPAGEIRLLAADSGGVRFELIAPELTLIESVDASALPDDQPPGMQSGCSQVRAEGFVQSAEPGRPQLPVKVCAFFLFWKTIAEFAHAA